MFSLMMSSSHSFDTVDMEVLDLVLGRAGLPVWFLEACFGYPANVRRRFKLSCGLGEPWTLHWSIARDAPISMVFLVAVCLRWCKVLESVPGVQPQLYVVKFKCGQPFCCRPQCWVH